MASGQGQGDGEGDAGVGGHVLAGDGTAVALDDFASHGDLGGSVT